jgi:hypothetical protein
MSTAFTAIHRTDHGVGTAAYGTGAGWAVVRRVLPVPA